MDLLFSARLNATLNCGAGTSESSLNPHVDMARHRYADVWKTTPFLALLLLAGLQTIQRIFCALRLEGQPIQASGASPCRC